MTKSKKRPTIQNKTPEIQENDLGDTSTTLSGSDAANHIFSESDATQDVSKKPSEVIVVEKPKKTPVKKSSTSKKSKHGKLSSSLISSTTIMDERPTLQIANIILHLKCSMAELQTYNEEIHKQMMNPLVYNPSVPPDIMTYHQPKFYSELNNVVSNVPSYDLEDYAYNESKANRKNRNPESINDNVSEQNNSNNTNNTYQTIEGQIEEYNSTVIPYEPENCQVEMKDIHVKLKKLKISLFKNLAFMDKKSACFWCTYDFDNPECYIPRYEMDGDIHGYGSFCRPECAAAYLMKENLDDSTKFERYHLLNHIYSKVYDYKKNIKPAPNPYYMLDKFYGNLTIQEYRKLLKSDHLLLVIDKPLTRILPELHEDNEEFLTNIYGVNTPNSSSVTSGTSKTQCTSITKHGIFKVRKQSDKPVGQTKSNIIKEHFGIK